MPEILTAFPTEPIPGRWRWMSEGKVWSVGHFARKVTTVTLTDASGASSSAVVVDCVTFVDGRGGDYDDGPWTVFDPDSDHFERVDTHPVASAPVSPHRVPTPEENDACPDPVGMVERVTGLRWADSGGVGVSQHLGWIADVYADWTRVNASNVNGAATVAKVPHPYTQSTHEALRHGSLAVLRAIHADKVQLSDGAPGMEALTRGDRDALGLTPPR